MKSEVEVEEDNDFYSDAESVKTHEICATINPLNINRKGFSDLTGTFPHKSSRVNFYVMVMYDYDINKILAEPIKTRQEETIRNALLNIHRVPKARGSQSKAYITENECYSELK